MACAECLPLQRPLSLRSDTQLTPWQLRFGQCMVSLLHKLQTGRTRVTLVPLRPDIASASAEVADEDAFAATLLGLYVRPPGCVSQPRFQEINRKLTPTLVFVGSWLTSCGVSRCFP